MGAPPHLFILLWHHAIYYKRHWVVTIWTLTKPLLVYLVMYVMLVQMKKTELMRRLQYRPCNAFAESSLTDGVLAAMLSHSAKQRLTTAYHTELYDTEPDQICLNDELLVEDKAFPNGNDQYNRYVDNLLSSDKWFLESFKADNDSVDTCMINQTYWFDTWYGYNYTLRKLRPMKNVFCQMLIEKIYYYPSDPLNPTIGDEIMTWINDLLEKRYLNNFIHNMVKVKGSPYTAWLTKKFEYKIPANDKDSDNPWLNMTNGRRPSLPMDQNEKYKYVWAFLNTKHHLPPGSDYRGFGSYFSNKYIKLQTVKGFENFEALQKETRNLTKVGNKTDYVPGVWGVVSFENTPKTLSDPSLPIKYSILYEMTARKNPFAWQDRSFNLQDLVERAIVVTAANHSFQTNKGTGNATGPPPIPFGLVLKEVPTRCWDRASEAGSVVFLVVMSFGCAFAFLSIPATMLTQILTEKQLKMREYLYIMGVSSTTLTVSWILFYSALLLPLSVIFMCLVVTTLGEYLLFSDVSYMFILFVGYNAAMLSFCYMLSNLFSDPKSSSQLLYCVHIFVILLVTVQFGARMEPGTVALARIASFHPMVPLIMGFGIYHQYERSWQGVGSENIQYYLDYRSPWGGMLESILWIYFDIILYLILSWYFEKVFPGEFGQKHVFYFPFLPSYWRPPTVPVPTIDANSMCDVETALEREPGIVINKLTKVYPNGKIGLKELELIFYKNEITAFLGHNGAGKSTTMNSLVGLITPTSGTASIHSYDIMTQMAEIRKILGFVPQYDILYPDLLVHEHLQLFGWLRGMGMKETEEVTDALLLSMGILTMKQQQTIRLSGGQKRKLSIITAYLGNPHVVIFDEPTSGVDVFSRRSIWDTILSHKANSTTILSTHFMDEADLLGERIAIVDEGYLKSCGSPMYLKNKYGKGYRLIIAGDPEHSYDKPGITEFITKLIPGSKLSEEMGSDLTFQIPSEIVHSEKLIPLLETVEGRIGDPLGIISYGLHEPTIEDVFFTSIHMDLGSVSAMARYATDVVYNKDTVSERTKLMRQALALFYKRFLFAFFSPSIVALQTLIPLMFLFMYAVTGKSHSGRIDVADIYNPTLHNVIFFNDKNSMSFEMLKNAFKYGNPSLCPGAACGERGTVPGDMKDMTEADPNKNSHLNRVNCSSCIKHCKPGDENTAQDLPHAQIRSGDTLYTLPANLNVTNWMILVNQSRRIVVAGFTFNKKDPEIDKFLDWLEHIKLPQYNVNESAKQIIDELRKTSDKYVTLTYHTRVKEAALNLFNTYLLRLMTGKPYQIELTLEPKLLSTPTEYVNLEATMDESFRSFWLLYALMFSTFGILIAIHYENSTGLKRLQLMYGANPNLYHFVNIVFDVLQLILSTTIICILLSIFDTPFNTHRWNVTVLMLSSALQIIGFYYLVSTLCAKGPSLVNTNIFVSMILSLLAIFVSAFMVVQYWCTQKKKCTSSYPEPEECLYGWAVYINDILSFLPMYVISDYIFQISHIDVFKKTFGEKVMDTLCEEEGCYCEAKNIYAVEFLGQRIIKTVVWGIIYISFVFVIEHYDAETFNFDVLNPFKSKVWQDEVIKSIVNDDVGKETERIESGNVENDNLIVKHLRKCYPSMMVPAVVDLSFGVQKSQVFGLLGINGAGKSTTFNMLTGCQRPTSGSASILGTDLFSRTPSRFGNSSYCPQENTLFQQLTIEQHIQLFAALRGVPHEHVSDIQECLIQEVGLDIHRGKKAGHLSGGNQRKLNLAIALLDFRPVIFLDEPTSGMDPGARRRTWNAVKRAVSNKGCSVVLTSHSMDECEALCHKIAIMVAGSFLCIGSIQYLKHKYGNKYMFKIKLQKQENRVETATKVKKFIKSKLPASRQDDEHANVITFDIPCSDDMKMSTLYKVLSDCRRQFLVEDVSVSQSSLEQVFLNMARVQEDIQTCSVLSDDPYITSAREEFNMKPAKPYKGGLRDKGATTPKKNSPKTPKTPTKGSSRDPTPKKDSSKTPSKSSSRDPTPKKGHSPNRASKHKTESKKKTA